jgi:hypothetical protein
MALLSRYNGAAAAGAFYGYTPLVIQIEDKAATGTLTANTGGAGSAITEGGYEKAIRAVQTLGSVIWVSSQAAKFVTFIVDGSTYNTGAGATTSGSFGALKDALTGAGFTIGSSNLVVTSSSALNGNGTFTFA